MALKAKPDKDRKGALPKPAGAEPSDKPVRYTRDDPSPNPTQTIEKKRPERRP